MTERRLAPLTALTTLARRRCGWTPAPRGPRAAAAVADRASRVVDNAVYSEGRRVATPGTAAESREELAAGRGPPGVARALPARAAGAG